MQDTHKRRYRISRDRHGIWSAADAHIEWGGMLRMTNSFGQNSANTITASEYKGAQKQKDKSVGYILVRYTP